VHEHFKGFRRAPHKNIIEGKRSNLTPYYS